MKESADDWLKQYRKSFPHYKSAAILAREQILSALNSQPFSIQLVEARAKEPDAVAEKIIRKDYSSPQRGITDLLGVRVILLFEHAIPDVVDLLKSRFPHDAKRSVNKTAELGVRQVGYRSNHVLLKCRSLPLDPDTSGILKSTYVEVQVRSVVSHAWAEIEHSLRYKVGAGVSSELARRFDALAGTLELVDREFTAIELATVQLVEEKAARYKGGMDLDDGVTTLNVMAMLKATRPRMAVLGPDGLLLPIEDAFKLANLLGEASVRTVSDLRGSVDSEKVRNKLRSYADKVGNIVPEEASGFVVLGAVIGTRKLSVFEQVELFTADQNLVAAVTDQ